MPLLLLSLFSCAVFQCVTVAQPTSPSSVDPCSSVNNYTQSHSGCYSYGSCTSLYCNYYYDYSYLDVYISECEDPPTVEVYYDDYGGIYYDYFQYRYNQSEIVDKVNSYGIRRRYIGIMARNASHIGFQLTVDRNDSDTLVLLDPVYFYLRPHSCLCDSMQAVGEDIDIFSDMVCNVTNDSCAELSCTVNDGIIDSFTISINQCASPPNITVSTMISGYLQSFQVVGNTTKDLLSRSAQLVVTVWYYQYSMDLQVILIGKDLVQEILSRHKIILDLTTCDGVNEPFDLSTAPPPTTEFTEPTPSSTTDSTYDTCAALQSISVADGSVCNTNQACTGLECQIAEERLEILIVQCHNPPGVSIVHYNGMGREEYNKTFYQGSNSVTDKKLPFDLNVTVEHISSSSMAIEVEGIVRSSASSTHPSRLALVPRTVIPIDEASCSTLVPPTSAPTDTCSSMRYIATALSRRTIEPCFFPTEGNCTVLTCPIKRGVDLTLHLLRCAHPPAIKLAYGTPLGNVFDQTFNDSKVTSLTTTDSINVTLDHLCPTSIGLKVSDDDNEFTIPYTVIPIDTTGCGPGSGNGCTEPHTPPLCTSLISISQQINHAPGKPDNCSTSKNCDQVNCYGNGTKFSIIPSCSPIGVTLLESVQYSWTKSKLFTDSGVFTGLSNISYNVSIEEKTSEGFLLSLVRVKLGSETTLVNKTFIPTGDCTSTSSLNIGLVVGAGVGVPLAVLLLLATIVIVIVVVYRMKRRRYRNYQLHRMAMSQVDDDEEPV